MIQYLGRLLKELENPPLFAYHVLHYMNRLMPLCFAKYIAKRNLREYLYQRTNDVLIETNDCSYQIVHPDVDMFNDKMIFIGTPYPYAMEEYENPCLYIGEDLRNLKQLLCPLDKQSEHTQGVHLSDPCVLVYDNVIKCIYRETIYKDDYIFIKDVTMKNGDVNVSDRKLLLSSKNDFILSPAVLIQENELLMYYVSTDKHTSSLILTSFNKSSYKQISHSVVNVHNEPPRFYLWHIGIVASDGSKILRGNEKMRGLFLYINQDDNKQLKLFIADADSLSEWYIKKEFLIPEVLKGILKFPYKSCYNPSTGKILLSYRDTKDRNRIVELDIKIH